MSIEINISNYESYFLSYIDDELNGEELAALELFLQKHPQFKQELELLEGVRLVPDEHIVFDNKASLYRTGSTAAVDYEELMLGYIDGELTVAEEQVLQEYLLKTPAAQKELSLLEVVKLTPDTSLVFADKTSLYRNSKRKMAPAYRRMGWGAAVAAVLAGLIIWLLPPGHHSTQLPSIAGNAAVQTPKVTTVPAPAMTSAPETAVPTPVAPEAAPSRKVQLPLVAKNKTTTGEKKPAVAPAAPVREQNDLAATTASKTDAPVMSQLTPQRNSMDEVVAQHLQQAGNAHVAAAMIKPEENKETVLAANITASNNNKITPVMEQQQGVQGELIMSVSGSDSRILDKVTNVAKFFSRKRNK